MTPGETVWRYRWSALGEMTRHLRTYSCLCRFPDPMSLSHLICRLNVAYDVNAGMLLLH